MPTPDVPSEALTRRFDADLRVIADVRPHDRIGIAVSGGPDSLALLLLTHAAFPGRVLAATVDHRLRPESTAEAAAVAVQCAALAVDHTILTLGTLPRGNVSATARTARYAALSEWITERDIAWLATGHHADDQAETLLMRLNRGSGVGGLAAIRARDGRVVRPLLGWRRAELEAIVAGAGLMPVDDPSNRDPRYDRARLRSALADADWIDPFAFARSAAALADADRALTWVTDGEVVRRIVRRGNTISLDARDLPDEIVRRLVAHCLDSISKSVPRDGPKVTRLIHALEAGGVATLDAVKCDGRSIPWAFSPAPPRRATG